MTAAQDEGGGQVAACAAIGAQPYGSWPSPLSAEFVARGVGRFFGTVWPEPDRLRWLEFRAEEGGRGVLVERLWGASEVTPLSTDAVSV